MYKKQGAIRLKIMKTFDPRFRPVFAEDRVPILSLVLGSPPSAYSRSLSTLLKTRLQIFYGVKTFSISW